MARKPATIADVARAAGVAIGTVSRVVNGSGPVSAATLERVRRAIARLNYVPDAAGRALRAGASRAVGVLTPTLANPIFAQSLAGLESEARRRGYSVVVSAYGYDPQRERAALTALAARRLEGLIVTPCIADAAALEALAGFGAPVALLFTPPGDATRGAALSTVDSRSACAEAVARAVGLGHRDIAFLGGAFSCSDRARARFQGYLDAMAQAGLSARRPLELPFEAGDGAFAAGLRALLTGDQPTTALICSNDLLALKAIAGARKLGVETPRDLSVIGFDGIEMGRLGAPSLATIAQPAEEMGRVASELLFEMIETGAAPRARILPHRFLPGGSLSAPRRETPRTGAEKTLFSTVGV